MSNGCSNSLHVSGDAEEMLRFKQDVKCNDNILCLKEHVIGRGCLGDETDSWFSYWFETPDMPSWQWLQEISGDYPLLRFRLDFTEPLGCFRGVIIFRNKQFLRDLVRSYDHFDEFCDDEIGDDESPVEREYTVCPGD